MTATIDSGLCEFCNTTKPHGPPGRKCALCETESCHGPQNRLHKMGNWAPYKDAKAPGQWLCRPCYCDLGKRRLKVKKTTKKSRTVTKKIKINSKKTEKIKKHKTTTTTTCIEILSSSDSETEIDDEVVILNPSKSNLKRKRENEIAERDVSIGCEICEAVEPNMAQCSRVKEHRWCQGCFQATMKSLGNTTFFCFAREGCQAPISRRTLTSLSVSQQLSMDFAVVEKVKEQLPSKDEIFMTCNGDKGCSYRWLFTGVGITPCEKCGESVFFLTKVFSYLGLLYCGKCRQSCHEGSLCEEVRQEKERKERKAQEDQEALDVLKITRGFRCGNPLCRQGVFSLFS